MAAEKKRTFWNMFTLVENGKIKSTFLLYAFALSFVFLAAYGLAFALLIDPIEHLFSGVSPLLAGVLECLLPSALGTVLCLLCQKAAKNKALAPAAFAFLAFACIVLGGLTLSVLESGEYSFFFMLYTQLAIVPLTMGAGATCYVWRRHVKEMRVIMEKAVKPKNRQRFCCREEE